jgi:hypothetical protein
VVALPLALVFPTHPQQQQQQQQLLLLLLLLHRLATLQAAALTSLCTAPRSQQ